MKVYKGWELLKAINDGEIKGETKIIQVLTDHSESVCDLHFIEHMISGNNLLTSTFKVLEEEKPIEELHYTGDGHADYTNVIPKINELVKEVNKLNKEMNK